MLKLGMLVEFGTLIKSEIAKPKYFLLQIEEVKFVR